MSFNFGAFLGGMSKQISTNIEDAKKFNREKEFRMDMLAEEEATKMRLAKSSERRSQRKQDEQNAALLKSMGYTDAQSGWIMQGGGATVTLYSDFAKKAYARGINPADILETNLINPDQQDPRNESALMSVIDSTRPESEVDAAKPFTVSQDIMTSVLGEVEEVKPPKQYTSLEAGHSGTYSLLQEAIKKGDKDEITRLEGVLEEWKGKIVEDIALRKPDDDTGKDPSYFTKPSRETIRKNALSDAYTEFDFETDLNGNITANLEGRQGAKIVARIAAADTIERQANVAEGVIDTNLMGEATSIRASAEQALTSYGQAIVEQKGGSDSKTKKFGYLKSTKEEPISNYKMNEGGNSGKYKVGDVVIAEVAQPEGGTILKVFVYTGRRDPNDMGIEVQGRKLYNFFHDAGRLY